MGSLPRESPVFYAAAIDYYVVTRYADIKAIFLDPETYSAAVTQLPLVQLVPEAVQILIGSGHRPQPSMVSLIHRATRASVHQRRERLRPDESFRWNR